MKQIYRDNFVKLADFLDALPLDYIHFDMVVLYNAEDNSGDLPEQAYPPTKHCGTSACALGHAPTAGITPTQGEDWNNYLIRNFGVGFGYRIYDWVFCPHWDYYDNTPRGAAARIRFLSANNWEVVTIPFPTDDVVQAYTPYLKVEPL